jgi:hypothetical protein
MRPICTGFAFAVQHTVPLTLLLMRTYTSTDSRQVGGLIDNLHRCTKVAFRQLVVELFDMIGDGASLLTLRHLALQTALGLINGLTHRERVMHHLELI